MTKLEEAIKLLTEIGHEAGKAARKAEAFIAEVDSNATIQERREKAIREYQEIVTTLNDALLGAHLTAFMGFDPESEAERLKKPTQMTGLATMFPDVVKDQLMGIDFDAILKDEDGFEDAKKVAKELATKMAKAVDDEQPDEYQRLDQIWITLYASFEGDDRKQLVLDGIFDEIFQN